MSALKSRIDVLKGNSVYFTWIHSKDKFLTIDIVIVPGLQNPLIGITKDEEDCIDIVLALDSCFLASVCRRFTLHLLAFTLFREDQPRQD